MVSVLEWEGAMEDAVVGEVGEEGVEVELRAMEEGKVVAVGLVLVEEWVAMAWEEVGVEVVKELVMEDKVMGMAVVLVRVQVKEQLEWEEEEVEVRVQEVAMGVKVMAVVLVQVQVWE